MTVTDEDLEFAYELFSGVGSISHRKMMGGLSIYADGQIFAILSADGVYYVKASGEFAKRLEQSGSTKFETGDGRSMNYWTLPDDALDDPETASGWGRDAISALGK